MTGPSWYKNALVGEHQFAGKQFWRVEQVLNGGRVLEWRGADGRSARSEATAAHPDYPTDNAVLAADRAKKRAKKDFYRKRGYYP
jgi:hypothetical protein